MREGSAGAARARGLTASVDDETTSPGQPSDGAPTLWVRPEALLSTLSEVAGPGVARPFLLLDLFCLDDTLGGRDSETAPTLVYLLMRAVPYAALRVKVRVEGEPPDVPSVTTLFASAERYERAAADICGVRFTATALRSDDEDAIRDEMDPEADDFDDELGFELALPRALALESLLGVTVPPRAAAIRVLRSELVRIARHLSWYAALAGAIGAAASASFAAADARRALQAVHALGGASANGAVVGGVAEDLPADWCDALAGFLDEMTGRAQDYTELALHSPTVLGTKGVSPLEVLEATTWAATGPLLRAAGLACDLRKAAPYCGYERYSFQVPTGVHGDLYDRARVRLLEVQQSLGILAQCGERMPAGPIAVDVPDALVPGEALAAVEGSRGVSACYVASDGAALFVHHRAPGAVWPARAASRAAEERVVVEPGGAPWLSAP